mmetsp:Transcript_113512/g.331695  ORF Transcript_113512/g.331695 Transcript_113512/m.331695 type:complete len:210 (+) Transcript_113512:138-767(+)
MASAVGGHRDVCKAGLAVCVILIAPADREAIAKGLVVRCCNCLLVGRGAPQQGCSVLQCSLFCDTVGLPVSDVGRNEVAARLNLQEVRLDGALLLLRHPQVPLLAQEFLLLLRQGLPKACEAGLQLALFVLQRLHAVLIGVLRRLLGVVSLRLLALRVREDELEHGDGVVALRALAGVVSIPCGWRCRIRGNECASRLHQNLRVVRLQH